MRRMLRVLLPTALAAGTMLALAPPASAATVNVGPGQSIQKAINNAAPGTVINVAAGTYRETLLIRKDGIKLRGAGDHTGGTLLLPPAKGNSFCGEGPGSFPGICVLATKLDDNFNIIQTVDNVEVSGFQVRNFPGDGVVSFGASTTRFLHSTANNNEGYGFTSFVSNGNYFADLQARNNLAPGFYIGDSPDADFTLINSVATGNELGILVREADNGLIRNNWFGGNCTGMFFLNHGNDPAFDVRVQNWVVTDNKVVNNNKVCPGAPDGPPPLKGAGVVLLGTKNISLANNTVSGNQGADPPAGGILVASAKSDGGQNPVGNKVNNNTAKNNAPLDVFYDGTGSGNQFNGNDCTKSQPASIC